MCQAAFRRELLKTEAALNVKIFPSRHHVVTRAEGCSTYARPVVGAEVTYRTGPERELLEKNIETAKQKRQNFPRKMKFHLRVWRNESQRDPTGFIFGILLLPFFASVMLFRFTWFVSLRNNILKKQKKSLLPLLLLITLIRTPGWGCGR